MPAFIKNHKPTATTKEEENTSLKFQTSLKVTICPLNLFMNFSSVKALMMTVSTKMNSSEAVSEIIWLCKLTVAQVASSNDLADVEVLGWCSHTWSAVVTAATPK